MFNAFTIFTRADRLKELYTSGTTLSEMINWTPLSNELKELYTSISTLAQKLASTLLNNELILKILNSTPFGQKIRKHFRPKIHKSQISA